MTKLRDDLSPEVRELCEAMLAWHCGSDGGSWLTREIDGTLGSTAKRLKEAFHPFLAKPETQKVVPDKYTDLYGSGMTHKVLQALEAKIDAIAAKVK